MGFAAIAVGIGIGAACGRQAMPTVVTELCRSATLLKSVRSKS